MKINSGKIERLADTMAECIGLMHYNYEREDREGQRFYLNKIRGIQEALDILGIPYEYKNDPDTCEVIGVNVAGFYARVNP